MSDGRYDLVVIGGGPGGYVGAIRASQLGLKVALVEADKLGGVCLNIGCIPSKSLIHQANEFATIPHLAKMGITVDTGGFDYRTVFKASRVAADTLSKGVAFLMKKNKIDVVTGYGRIDGPGEVRVNNGEQRLKSRFILLATGSQPRIIPGFEFDGKQVLSSNDSLMQERLPSSTLILGAGAIGMEFAHIYNAFGVDVTVVEMLDSVLPLEDREMASVVAKSFSKRGIKLRTATKALSVEKSEKGCAVVLEKPDGVQETVSVEQVLVVVGRVPNTEDIGLEKVGIASEKGFVIVGDFYRTSARGIYAIGDIVPSPMLAHVASKEAEIAVEHMAGKEPPQPRLAPDCIPGAVYCEPQIAGFGLTQERAARNSVAFAKATFPYRGAGKSVAIGRSEGMVKVLYNPESKEILGCHVVGAEATELVHELLLARTAELLPQDIAGMVHAHPTLSEAVMEAMRTVEGWPIHA